jgi:hypothetical protein
MAKKQAASGAAAAKASETQGLPMEGIVVRDGQEMYFMADVDRIPPFLMSLVSDSDHWMFISSTGGLTAGRVDEEHALFPYDTDDLLHLAAGATGPVTLLRVASDSQAAVLWEPMTDRIKPAGAHRNLYKSVLGNRLILEEVHPGLGLTFRYEWTNSDRYGHVRTATLERHAGATPARIEVLDGLLNLLPAGTDWFGSHRFSCLLNAYTRCEVDAETGLGMFALSSIPIDRAEPAEALRANVVWSQGLDPATRVVGPEAVRAFREGRPVEAKSQLKGRRGAYLVASEVVLADGQSKTWRMAADVGLTQAEVVRLCADLKDPAAVEKKIAETVAAGTANLRAIIASADGLQESADRVATAHHQSNVLFNCMRGGVFMHNYDLPGADFAAFVRQRNKKVAAAHETLLAGLKGTVNYRRLLEDLEKTGDAALVRLGQEYLPLTFSRRHGDPSRPWNRFAIHVRDRAGGRVLAYQGNWRDIFQNWEALAVSYPAFLESLIAKFVNASTVDGFNPYRVSQTGIDWEAPSPEEPWANIGYWGDHQIIYLLKFLEAAERFHPGSLEKMLDRPLYTYANVPYRIKPYASIVEDPHATILYDFAEAKRIEARVAALGSDGRLLLAPDGGVVHVTLAEKLLVSTLAKLSNLVPDGGIWMNTQRPEWNDANNALVGYGISVVTLAYLRRHLAFSIDLLDRMKGCEVPVSAEVVAWCEGVASVLATHRGLLAKATISDEDRRTVLDGLGRAFSAYRETVYAKGFSSGRKTCKLAQMADLFRTALEYVDHGLRANRREDGLYHAYNLINLSPDGKRAGIDTLYEMLEGQVAALSSGLVEADEALTLLKALRTSRMYRPDQDSFLLYPDRALPGFLERGIIPAADIAANELLTALIVAGNHAIVLRDVAGAYRFSGEFRSGKKLAEALDKLAADARWTALVKAHGAAVRDLYERVFNHRAFTGRSGTMYGYEGLGCIYWHMVAKLLLGVQETFNAAARAARPAKVLKDLAEAYYQVRAGLGFTKSATVFGAIPLDPYSHTPGHAGAQQPGMTGQVKEEVLTRLGELGLGVEGGQLVLCPRLLRRRELLAEPTDWAYIDVDGKDRKLVLDQGSLAMTVCQVPVVYEATSGAAKVCLTMADGSEKELPGDRLDRVSSAAVFNRTGEVRQIRVEVPTGTMLLE